MRTPLGVLEKVRPAERGLDFAPLALALACAALTYVLSAEFVFAPGMYVGFDQRPGAVASTLVTPRAAVAPDLARTSLTVTLVSARGTGVYVVAGRVVDRTGLDAELRRVAASGGSARPVLIKADASLTMQMFLEVCELARQAGFPGVLLAADER
jgi:biopolymer transport protein ExbD